MTCHYLISSIYRTRSPSVMIIINPYTNPVPVVRAILTRSKVRSISNLSSAILSSTHKTEAQATKLLPSKSTTIRAFRSLASPRNIYSSFDINSEVLLQKSLISKYNNSNSSTNSNLYNDNYVRCTIINKHGDLDSLSLDIKRKDLILKYKLMPRDIRKINYRPTYQANIVPYISVRNDSILVNLLHIRALIKNDSVILFDSPGWMDSHNRQVFIDELRARLKQQQDFATRSSIGNSIEEDFGNSSSDDGHHAADAKQNRLEFEGEENEMCDNKGNGNGTSSYNYNDSSSASGLPYEMRAIESIFMSVTHTLNQEIKVHKNVIRSILVDLENHIHTENLRLLLDQNKKITAFYQKAKLIRDAIDDLLKQDDLLSDMYLSEPRKDITDHAEVEILLETYYKHFDEAVQIVEEIINNIKTTQEIINIILDSNRNQLMLLGLRFSIGILFLGCGIYVASVYGMNLENFIEEKNYGFGLVVGLTTIVSMILFFASIKRVHRLERIAVSGNKSMPAHRHAH